MEVWLYIMEVYGSVGAAVLQCAGLPPVSPLHPPHLCSYSIPWRWCTSAALQVGSDTPTNISNSMILVLDHQIRS